MKELIRKHYIQLALLDFNISYEYYKTLTKDEVQKMTDKFICRNPNNGRDWAIKFSQYLMLQGKKKVQFNKNVEIIYF
jgi:hypothetical protein